MKRRTAVALIGVLALASVGLVLAAAYPFATSEPHAANSPGDRFAVSETDAYTASGSIVVDGRERLSFQGAVTADGGWYRRLVDDDVVVETFQATENATVFHRLTVDEGEEAEARRARIADDGDADLVCEERNGDRATVVYARNGTGVSQRVSGAASVVVNSLTLAGYEAGGADSSGVAAYGPQSGWYDGTETYRVTDASGTVRADADTLVVESANVSFDVTAPAGSYAEYVLRESFGDEPTRYRITFEFDPDDVDLERPAWVAEADRTSDGGSDDSRSDPSTAAC